MWTAALPSSEAIHGSLESKVATYNVTGNRSNKDKQNPYINLRRVKHQSQRTYPSAASVHMKGVRSRSASNRTRPSIFWRELVNLFRCNTNTLGAFCSNQTTNTIMHGLVNAPWTNNMNNYICNKSTNIHQWTPSAVGQYFRAINSQQSWRKHNQTYCNTN